MRKTFTQSLRKFICSALLLLSCTGSYASHIVGADLSYTYVSGNTYTITMVLYGNCGPASSAAFSTLPTSSPQVCIYDGATYVTSANLAIQAPINGVEVTLVCPGEYTQCQVSTSTIPGVKKFVYSATVTLPHTSATWRFIYNGYNGPSGSSAGRAAAITNLLSPGSTTMQLIDTLNNAGYNNSSPAMNTSMPYYFPINQYNNYNPMAVDPDGDSLVFSFVSAANGTEACSAVGGDVAYTGNAWAGTTISATTPLAVMPGSFCMNSFTGQLSFYPNVLQRAIIVFNIREYRAGVLVGTSQREMSITVITASAGNACSGTPNVGPLNIVYDCSIPGYVLSINTNPCGGVSYQWQYSCDTSAWANIPGATSYDYGFASSTPGYYRCAEICDTSTSVAYSGTAYIPAVTPTELMCSIINNPDSNCAGAHFHVSACNIDSPYNITTFYGDGTFNNIPLSAAGVFSYADIFHYYTAPGHYTIKQILYDGIIAIDSTIFSYQYLYCHILPIKIYIDNNSDCIKESAEPYNSIPILVQVDSNSVPIDTLSVTSGIYYQAHGLPGTIYSFSVISAGYYTSCPSSEILYDTIVPIINAYPVRYFGLQCSSGSNFDLAVKDVVPVTGEHDEWGNIYVSNKYCTPTNATVVLHYDTHYNVDMGSYLDVNPTPASYTDSTVTWNVTGLSSSTHAVDLYYAIWTDNACCGYLPAGLPIHTYVTVSPTVGDMDTANNNCVVWDTVKAGCDPNEMSVSPSGCIASGSGASQLQYVINFMNVGNDTAFNIAVMDTLSPNVDPNSLRIMMASNTMNIAVFNDGIHNIVKFDFPQINLLDSAVCPQCSGAVIFNINTLPSLLDGTTIFNHAGVFFDYNPVVVTNTVENIIGCATTSANNVKHANNLSIFPNPTTEELIIKMSPNAYASFSITNSIGQEILQQPLTLIQTSVNVSALTPGLYYITFRGDNGTKVQKFVKM